MEVRELSTTWGTPAQSFAAAVELLALYANVHGWPPPDDPIDQRDDLEVWGRFVRLRARLGP